MVSKDMRSLILILIDIMGYVWQRTMNISTRKGKVEHHAPA